VHFITFPRKSKFVQFLKIDFYSLYINGLPKYISEYYDIEMNFTFYILPDVFF